MIGHCIILQLKNVIFKVRNPQTWVHFSQKILRHGSIFQKKIHTHEYLFTAKGPLDVGKGWDVSAAQPRPTII